MMNLTANLIPLYMYLGNPLPRPERLYDYLIASQGIVKRIESPVASVDLLLAPLQANLIGLRLQPYPLQPLKLKVPRIPGRLLEAVLADARDQIEQEVMYQFRLEVGGGWVVTRPVQERSRARVGYRGDPTGVILDLHSHHLMPAFFSGTDDADEQGGRLYAVIGHLDRPRPQLILRLGAYGHYLYNVPALAVFEDIGPFSEVYVDGAEVAGYDGDQNGWLSLNISGPAGNIAASNSAGGSRSLPARPWPSPGWLRWPGGWSSTGATG
jgi:PRTRC genetic system protein A